MKTPKEKYMNDPEYRHLVDILESLIERAHFTPSEMREACVLACINYEMRHVRDMAIDRRTENAMMVLDEFVSKRRNNRDRNWRGWIVPHPVYLWVQHG